MAGSFSSRRDELFYVMTVDGWATESGGSVESPTGWFAYMTNDPADIPGIRDAFPEFEDVPDSEIVGVFSMREDSNGFWCVEKIASRNIAQAIFRMVSAEFAKWDDDES